MNTRAPIPVPDLVPTGYELKPLTLRFADEELERRFMAEHIVRALPTIRTFLCAASALYGVFGILDAYTIPDASRAAWTIRYAGVCPLLLGVMLLSYTRVFIRIAQPALAAAVLGSGLGILGMTALAEAPGNALYYAGLVMVVIYGSSLIRLRCVNAALVSLALVGLYQLVALWINPIPTAMLINNDFFLGMSVAMGIFSAYVQELFVRRDFINTDIIVQAKRVSDELRIHAEAANKAKSEFFAVMSHELRTPLNAILGFSELMQQRVFGPLGSERYAAYVDDIHGTGKHLLNIITDILDLSKAEAGKLTLSEEVVDVGEVLGQCLHLLRERAAEQELVLFLTLPPERVHLRADARLLKQVTINLLNNAIKFTPTGGTVEVALEIAEDGGCSVRVTDTGIGIAEEDLSRVLEPFVQVESAFVRKHGGTGLGLALVQKVTELHGATVSISSALGAGTTIVIAFPAERLAALAQAPASAKVA